MPDLQIEPWRPGIETYHRLTELGAFEDVRVELLDGVITPMSPKGREHEFAIAHLNRVFVEGTGAGLDVRVQCALSLGDEWEPEPDFAIVHRDAPGRMHPTTAKLVCEVSDSSLRRDREVKGYAYARAGLPEYWIVAIPDRTVEVHSDPTRLGYQSIRKLRSGTLVSAVLPALALDVDALWAAAFR